jgi:hypothetical protein
MKCFKQKDDMDTRRALDITGFGDMGTFDEGDISDEKTQIMLMLANFVEDFDLRKERGGSTYEEYEILKELEYYSLKLRALNYLERLLK